MNSKRSVLYVASKGDLYVTPYKKSGDFNIKQGIA